MDHSIEVQQAFWNRWNAAKGERPLSDISRDQRDVVVQWLTHIGRTDLDILEVGCGAGWMCPSLKPFGRVTGTDISDAVLQKLSATIPDVAFVAGEFMALDFEDRRFDVVVTLEVLSHMPDHPAFIAKLASLLRPGGWLMLATQNRPVLEQYNNVPPAPPEQLRHWVDRSELASLLAPHFDIVNLRAISPTANKGLYRLILGQKSKRAVRAVFGRALENVMANAGLGWTLVTLAQKR
jgi:2-polyprenyl-3-methyl-5-hydroxy-6-metoxy-1,4-benzoquinol methylase